MTFRNLDDVKRTVQNIEFDFTVGEADHSTCTISLKDRNGTAIGESMPILVWISDSAVGAGLAAVGPTGLAEVSGHGAFIQEVTAEKSLIALTDAGGELQIDITDDTTKSYYVCAVCLAGGSIAVSRIMTADDFGVA